MLKNKKTTLAVWIAAVMTVVVIALRLTLVPWAQGLKNPLVHPGYIVIGLILMAAVALFVLLRLSREEMPLLPSVGGKFLLPMAVTTIAVGGCILLNTITEMYMWSAYGVTPPPGTQISGGVDRLALFLTMVFGVLAGVYFVRLGAMWLRLESHCKGSFPLWAMAPTFWIWVRLARYEISYASAVEVHESFYDFAMLIMSMLFLFAFARVMSDVNPKKPYITIFLALCTALLSVSGSVARVFLFLLGEGDLSRAGQLAGVSDFAVGLLATAFVLYWLFEDEPLVAEEIADVSIIDQDAQKMETQLQSEDNESETTDN